ncbi:amidase family protein [Pseudomonas sp. ADAK18]|uniref:amidase family protein n=1 Tax=Pseudomonas sp. ADAK18 TaxID=2730848 RepID=UPI001EED7FEB|nr:amidase family protein [Pseudomonas sp. ADAK18]
MQPTRLVFGSLGSGAIIDSSARQGSLEFDTARSHLVNPLPRFDVPGPMMSTVRDPALLLIAMSGADPEGPVMVEIPPVVNPGNVSNCALLTGSRIGFASEYLSGNDRQTIEHSAHFTWVLKVLNNAGAQLVPVLAHRLDDTRHFTLDSSNEIDDRVAEGRLDALVSDASSVAFHPSATSAHPKLCVSTGLDADGTATSVWFYGAHWASDPLVALVHGCQQVLAQALDSARTP